MRNNLEDLERMLICPVCRSRVRLVDHKFWCVSAECRRSYPIDDDLPIMLESESTVEATAAPETVAPETGRAIAATPGEES